MKITDDHWLEGVKRELLPGGAAMNVRRFLVIHNTAGWTAESSISWWRDPDANGANAHIIIDRDGTIFQCRPFNRTCGHAGKSSWSDPKTDKAYSGLNSCSIGIELANAADEAHADATAFPSKKHPNGLPLPAGVIQAKHKHGGPLTYWERYTPEQIAAVKELSKTLVARYNLDDVVGHEDIAKFRKTDPGPAFPMLELREHCGFKGLPM